MWTPCVERAASAACPARHAASTRGTASGGTPGPPSSTPRLNTMSGLSPKAKVEAVALGDEGGHFGCLSLPDFGVLKLPPGELPKRRVEPVRVVVHVDAAARGRGRERRELACAGEFKAGALEAERAGHRVLDRGPAAQRQLSLQRLQVIRKSWLN